MNYLSILYVYFTRLSMTYRHYCYYCQLLGLVFPPDKQEGRFSQNDSKLIRLSQKNIKRGKYIKWERVFCSICYGGDQFYLRAANWQIQTFRIWKWAARSSVDGFEIDQDSAH